MNAAAGDGADGRPQRAGGDGVVSAAVLDVEAGRVAASRRELAALVAWAQGRADADDPLVSGLARAGLIDGGALHPVLRPVVAVLAGVHARAAVRSWRGGARPVVEVLVGAAGVLVLPGGYRLDVPQDLRWHPRPSALPRVLADIADVTAGHGPPPVDARPRPWTDLVALACDRAAGVGLVDLRWSPRPGAPSTSALVVAWSAAGGIGEIVPAERDPALLTCRPRHPVEVWTALTYLARPRGGQPSHERGGDG